MKIVKIISKIILVLLLGTILLLVNYSILIKIPFGITLPVGWHGTCFHYEHGGFPFSVLSIPPPGTLCSVSFNAIGYTLNFVFLILVAYIFSIILRKKYKNK